MIFTELKTNSKVPNLSKKVWIPIALLAVAAAVAFLAFSSSSSSAPQQVGSTELYTREIIIDDTKIQLVAKSVTLKDESGEWQSGEYNFSGTAYNGEPFEMKVESMVPPEYDPNTGIDPLLIEKDISGDGSPEIIITVVKGSQTTAHEILWYYDKKLENVIEQNPITDDQESKIAFDEIRYEYGYTYLTSHGGDSRQEVQHEFNKGSLIVLGSISIMAAADTSDPNDCYVYLTLGKEKNEVQKENCDIWTEDLKPYWTMLYQNSYSAAVNELLKYVPSGDSAIDVIVDTYYDLTLHYGNASDNSIFDKSGKFDPGEFFRPLLPNTSSWENRAVMQNEAFKQAFFIPEPAARSFELPLPLGAAIGGEVAGKKLLDENTMLVYAFYYVQAHLGPAGDMCKEEGMVIDKWTFKKIQSGWRIAKIEESVDSWDTAVQSQTDDGCVAVNDDKVKSYMNP